MRMAVMVLMMALTGCETPIDTARRADERAVGAANEAALLRVKVADLEARIAKLEGDLKARGEYWDAVGESLKEARSNHDSLRKTFNGNVDIGNQRDAQQDKDIDWLMARNGVFRRN